MPNAPLLSTLYVYITNRCNLNCRHCWIDPGQENQDTEKVMELGLLISILEQSYKLGMRSLKITGGEPFLYDDFRGVLEFLRNKDWQLYLHMETNGTLIDKDMALALKQAGMKFVAISIDGDNPDTHDHLRGTKGSFDKAVGAVRHLVGQGIPVQIITSVYRRNLGELTNIAKIAEGLKAESIKANIITTMGRATQMADNQELLSIEEMIELNRKIEGEYREKFKLRFCSSMPVAFRSLKHMLEERTGFCRVNGLLGILANGKVSLCGIGQERQELVLGDARTDSIKDIWEKNPILWRIRNEIPSKLEGVCKICIFKNYCLGHCIAQNYYSTGRFYSPFWICQEAYAKRLFPKRGDGSSLLNQLV